MKPAQRLAASLLGALLLGSVLAPRLPAEPASPPSTSVSTSQQQAWKVELAWLADPSTFPCPLQAQVAGDTLEVQGYVPSEAVRRQALSLAEQECSLQVIDQLKIHPQASRPVDRPIRPTALGRGAVHLLMASLGKRARGFRVEANSRGQVIVEGKSRSLEEKLAVSRRLQLLYGCQAVINRLEVASARKAPRKAPGRIVVQPVPVTRPVLQAKKPVRNAPRVVKVARPVERPRETEPSVLATPRVPTQWRAELQPTLSGTPKPPLPPVVDTITAEPVRVGSPAALKTDQQVKPAVLSAIPSVVEPPRPAPARGAPLASPTSEQKVQSALLSVPATRKEPTTQEAVVPIPSIKAPLKPPQARESARDERVSQKRTWPPAHRVAPPTDLPRETPRGQRLSPKAVAAPTSGVALLRLRYRVASVCGPWARDVKVTSNGPEQILVEVWVHNVYSARVLRERLQTMIPELGPGRAKVQLRMFVAR